MSECHRILANFLKREDGPTAVEYAVMLALIVLMCVTAITALDANSEVKYQKANTAFVGS